MRLDFTTTTTCMKFYDEHNILRGRPCRSSKHSSNSNALKIKFKFAVLREVLNGPWAGRRPGQFQICDISFQGATLQKLKRNKLFGTSSQLQDTLVVAARHPRHICRIPSSYRKHGPRRYKLWGGCQNPSFVRFGRPYTLRNILQQLAQMKLCKQSRLKPMVAKSVIELKFISLLLYIRFDSCDIDRQTITLNIKDRHAQM